MRTFENPLQPKFGVLQSEVARTEASSRFLLLARPGFSVVIGVRYSRKGTVVPVIARNGVGRRGGDEASGRPRLGGGCPLRADPVRCIGGDETYGGCVVGGGGGVRDGGQLRWHPLDPRGHAARPRL